MLVLTESRAGRKTRAGGSEQGDSGDEGSQGGTSSVASGSVGSKKRDKKRKKDFIKRNKEVITSRRYSFLNHFRCLFIVLKINFI